MKFKVGDKVRVREDLVEGDYYGGECFIGLMGCGKGKVFEIKEICGRAYILGEDGFHWTDEMLEEVQEKTFREVIADIKEGEVWESAYVTIWVDSAGTHIKGISSNTCISNSIKFKLKRKEYTFAEAFKAYEEGEEIESCVNGIKFKKKETTEGDIQDFYFGKHEKVWWRFVGFDLELMRGKWYINN